MDSAFLNAVRMNILKQGYKSYLQLMREVDICLIEIRKKTETTKGKREKVMKQDTSYKISDIS